MQTELSCFSSNIKGRISDNGPNGCQTLRIPVLAFKDQGTDLLEDASTFLIGLCKIKIEF